MKHSWATELEQHSSAHTSHQLLPIKHTYDVSSVYMDGILQDALKAQAAVYKERSKANLH